MPSVSTSQGTAFLTGPRAADRADTPAVADTLLHSVSNAAPAANAVQAAISSPTPGTYKVVATVSLTGTAETQLANLRLRVTTVSQGAVATIVGTTQYTFERVTIASGNIDLMVAANATAGSIYTTSLQATRIA